MRLSKRPNSPNWFLEVQFKGKKYVRSTKTDHKPTAKKIAEDLYRQIQLESVQGRLKQITFKQAAERYFKARRDTPTPYFLKPLVKSGNTIILKNQSDEGTKIARQTISKEFFPWSPSWSEITYNAFGMPTIELHNELYGYLQDKNKKFDESSFEAFLQERGLNQDKSWIRDTNGSAQARRSVTLQTFIRHSIHHPENRNNDEYTIAELQQSIQEMINLL